MFAFRETRGAIDVAFTDRHGGVSGGPYASLNLGGRGDDRARIGENLDIVTRAFAHGDDPGGEKSVPAPGAESPTLVTMRQVQGADVGLVDRAYVVGQADRAYVVGQADLPSIQADALVTGEPDVVLMVRAADCVPVLLADVEQGVVGAAHAGRPGLVAGVVPNTVRVLREMGGKRLVAWVGPHVCGACYEVPDVMRAEVAAVVPQAYAQTSWGTPALDIGAGVRAQLDRDGVEVVDASRCTMTDQDLFSYRRQGVESGRQAGMIWVRR